MDNITTSRFFLWECFKIDGSENYEHIINVAVKRASKDATNQGAFNTRDDLTKEKKKTIKETCEKAVVEALKGLNKANEFDDWHKETCEALEKVGFTIGNAQKIVNMSLKYLYLIASCCSQIYEGDCNYIQWYDDGVKRFESVFHIPLDNYVLQYVCENSYPNELDNTIKKRGATDYRICDGERIFCWSRINDYDLYKKVQKALMSCFKYKNPIEWENRCWVEIAKNRRISNDQDNEC